MARRYDPYAVRDRLRAFALTFPDSELDHPWDSDVVKTNGKRKIFVFLGHDDPEYPPSIGVKLDESLDQALQADGAAPSGYGLGKAGWVQVPLRPTSPPVEVLEDWIEESYRRVALKRLVKELDARAG